MNKGRIKLSVEEAIACLPDGDTIHTFIAHGFLAGADWSREAVLDHIKEHNGAEIGGPFMRRMKHGICLDPTRRLFCEHDEDALTKIEASPVGGAK